METKKQLISLLNFYESNDEMNKEIDMVKARMHTNMQIAVKLLLGYYDIDFNTLQRLDLKINNFRKEPFKNFLFNNYNLLNTIQKTDYLDNLFSSEDIRKVNVIALDEFENYLYLYVFILSKLNFTANDKSYNYYLVLTFDNEDSIPFLNWVIIKYHLSLMHNTLYRFEPSFPKFQLTERFEF